MVSNNFEIFSFFIMIFSHIQQYVTSDSPLAPALYVFGDSLFDSGNNNFLPTLARADFNPYGVNFTHGATGRFTNGKTIADFIAEYLGLPFPPPYMSFLQGDLPLTGLNYASGSCGILSDTANYAGKCLNFDDQINMFQQTVEQRLPRQNLTSSEISDYLSKSIFVITIGSNDYINNYLLPNLYDSSRLYTPKSFATILANTLSKKLELLFLLGGRKFLVYEIGPIGCIPSITRNHKHNGTCAEEINQFALLFNYQLAPMLQNLTSSLKGSTFTLGHSYWLAYDAIMNPANYGLTNSRNPCCTIWENGTWLCIPELSPCKDIDKHFFWDGYHLTEAAYTFLVKPCFNDSTTCIPLNMKELLIV